jgi:hypothetical protein
MKRFLIITLIFFTVQTHGQNVKKTRPIAWVIPSVNTRINGLAGGLIINSLKDNDSLLTTVVNGLSLELIGVGFFLPLAPSSPIYSEPDSFYYIENKVDSIVCSYNRAKYRINGISISAGGIGGHDININGLNLSGINTLTAKTNGFSVCLLFNINGVVNGVSIGGLVNNTVQSKGLQIGLFNKTTRLRGFQIGLWNKNEKRGLPIINWNFND